MSHAVCGAVAVALMVMLMGGAAWADAKVISLREETFRGEVAEGGPVALVVGMDCAQPPPSAGARVIGFYAPGATEYRTDVTMHAERGPTRESTWSIRVEVEDGTEPLYLGLTSGESVIWNFEGAVERIERVILNGTLDGQGTEGIPAERVGVMDKSCHEGEDWEAHFLSDEGWERDPRGVFAVAVGRPFEVLPVTGLIDAVRLPSGRTARGERRGSGYNPLQFHEVDMASLVTSRPVDRPEILPGFAGVQQLVARGDLVEREGEAGRYTVVSQLDWLPNAPVVYHLGEGIGPPAGQVFPVTLYDSAGERLSIDMYSGRLATYSTSRGVRPPRPLSFWQ